MYRALARAKMVVQVEESSLSAAKHPSFKVNRA